MALILKDDQVQSYHECWSAIVATAVTKGQTAIKQDVFGFYMTAGAAGDEVTFIYEATQVRADKETGTGEAIISGDFVYYNVATGLVTANPTGTIGTDYYFIGIAKDDAAATDSTAWIHFWGHEYNFADRA